MEDRIRSLYSVLLGPIMLNEKYFSSMANFCLMARTSTGVIKV